jgi:hypothetical protein
VLNINLISVLPPFIVAALHLWFKESPELALDGPSDAVPLLIPALYDVLAVRQYVSVDPDALSENRLRNFLRHLIFLSLSALNNSPETLATAMGVLAEGPGSHS